MHYKKALVSYGIMVILFLPKYIIYVQSINTVMCHYCDTWLTPYVEVLLYKYVCKFKEVIRLKHLLFSVKGGSHNCFSSNLCWIGQFIGLNAVGFQLICLRPLAWKNVEIIRPIPVKQWLVLETGYLLLFGHHSLHCDTKMLFYATTASSLIWFS